MAGLDFIIGRAGTGKTRELYRRIAQARAEGKECFLIVPEQATFEAEKQLSQMLSGGLMGVTAASWSNLARKLLDRLGVRRAFLSPQGRLMLLRRSTDSVAASLTVFKKSAAHKGFPAEIGGLISQFKRCGFDPEGVKSMAEELDENSPLRDKLLDIAAVYAELERRTKDRYIDPEDMMRELIARAGETPLAGARVFVDGGDTMNEQAYPLVKKLLETAESITFALLGGGNGRDEGLFDPEERVMRRLREMAEEAGVPCRVTRMTERKRPGTAALKHLERELFSFPLRIMDEDPEGLSVRICTTRTEEVTEAAELIRRAAAEGMRMNEMAVTVSDLEGYAPLIKRIFPQYGIPYFTEAKRSLISYPQARLIINALEACRRGFDTENMLELIKSGLMPITREEAEAFEEAVLEKGMMGKRFAEPFTGELTPLDGPRERLMAPLVRLREASSNADCETRARAVHAFLEELGIYGRQQELCTRLHEEGRYLEEEENAQVVSTVLEVLDQLFVIMGDERLGMQKFISVIREGFASYEIGAIPTTCDQVLVGSVDRTRVREARLVAVLGMNEGLFPKKRPDSGVIDDGDLKLLADRGHRLWNSTSALTQSDVLTVYSSLTKATERLAMFYPMSIAGAGAMDSSAAPCRIINTVRRIFPRVPVTDSSVAPSALSSESAAFAGLGARIRRMIDSGVPDEETELLLSRFSRSQEYGERFRRIAEEAFGNSEAAPIPAELAKKLYGSRIYGSASRLETFNGCPFRHLMQYGLAARERELHREKNTELGSFYHEALEAYVRYVMDNGLEWRDIDDEMTFSILEELLPGIMYREGGHLLYDTARQRARLWNVIETVRYTCCAVTRHIAAGKFRPMGCEVRFGGEEGLFPPLKVEAGENVFYISGIIDRIDSFDNEGERADRIIDYKSGYKRFSFEELKAGLQLQLPLYAAAVEAARTVGMYYMPVKDIKPESSGGGEAAKQLTDKLMAEFSLSGLSLRDETVMEATEEFGSRSIVLRGAGRNKEGELTGSGFASDEEFGDTVSFAKTAAAQTLRRILDGEDAILPARLVKGNKPVCRWCPYGDVCRFDADLSRNGYRDIYPMSAESFFGRE